MKLTNKEASEWLIAIKRDYIHGGDEDYDERRKLALDMGAEALKNQEIMQVELEGDGYADGELVYDYGKCHKCGWDFEYGDKDWEEPYCCHCGQRLHWFKDKGE